MSRKKKILVVEDDSTVARGLKDLLQSEDYAVRIASNGKEAVTKAFTLWPDLILLDVMLPKLSGFEVCRQLRAKGYLNPVLMLTARTEQIDKLMGLEVGADDYIAKPFDTREVLARVRAHLRRTGVGLTVAGTGRHNRRLLSIMFTDIKDYAKKMNQDEKLALALLKTNNDTTARAVARHGGRIVENIGDAFLVSFDSALKAVECAAAIQRDLKKHNLSKPTWEQIRVRIGIHLGDVIEVDGKLRGDTINIAARLQQIALAGQVNISESVFESIKARLKIKTTKLGTQRVRNIKQPITVYRVSV